MGGWCPCATALAPQGTLALEASRVGAPGETKTWPARPRAGTLPPAALRKEVSTAQWEGTGKPDLTSIVSSFGVSTGSSPTLGQW